MELTIGGWIFLIVAMGIIAGLCIFSMYKVLFGKRSDQTEQ